MPWIAPEGIHTLLTDRLPGCVLHNCIQPLEFELKLPILVIHQSLGVTLG